MASVKVESRKPGQNSEVKKLCYQTEVAMASGPGIFCGTLQSSALHIGLS